MSGDQELTCQELVELVTDYLEAALLPETRGQVEAHLEGCPGCQAYLKQVRMTIALVRTLAQPQMLPTTRQELLQRFRDWQAE